MGRAARIVSLDTDVTTIDGVPLATDVTVADDGERHPVLLVRTPYGRASVRGAYDAIGLARLGWAVVTQDVRGRWDSPGTFSPFRAERMDGAQTIAWCASQPWSNGAVAMAGGSYNGFTQWLAAAERPAALRAIAPAVAGPTIRDAVYEGGALQLGVFSSWTLGIGALGSNLDTELVDAAIDELDRWPASLDGLPGTPTLTRISPDWSRWLDTDDTELWNPLDAGAAPGHLGVAGYHLAGWHDLFCESTIRGYTQLAGRAADDGHSHRRQRLVIGPWAHATMLRRTTGHLDFGVRAQGDFNGLLDEQIAFLSETIADRDGPSGVRVFVMGANRWLDLADWPPPTQAVPLYLAEGGRLSWSAPAESGTDHYRHDPSDPVPTNGGRTLHPVPPEAGPLDQRSLEERPDVLVYTSDVLERDLTIVGMVRAHVVFESTAPLADVTVKLVDVHPDGTAMLVVDSIRRVPTPGGNAVEVEVEVGSTAQTFSAGHRIRVEIASSNYPRFDTCEAADQTVHHGGRAASRLVLPIWT
ncbi:CocE/NonD family hydrolase [Actinopolymorpha alba]|uniref:CocE/NonD family hydrolase n=1 Tax=Actinopolymorpha alba TaxID=533267 RepID=UPI0003A21CE7|nr:CocE/NonD family hydrolase [Actinopolymorpha alba]